MSALLVPFWGTMGKSNHAIVHRKQWFAGSTNQRCRCDTRIVGRVVLSPRIVNKTCISSNDLCLPQEPGTFYTKESLPWLIMTWWLVIKSSGEGTEWETYFGSHTYEPHYFGQSEQCGASPCFHFHSSMMSQGKLMQSLTLPGTSEWNSLQIFTRWLKLNVSSPNWRPSEYLTTKPHSLLPSPTHQEIWSFFLPLFKGDCGWVPQRFLVKRSHGVKSCFILFALFTVPLSQLVSTGSGAKSLLESKWNSVYSLSKVTHTHKQVTCKLRRTRILLECCRHVMVSHCCCSTGGSRGSNIELAE